jgi:hypothetical protein
VIVELDEVEIAVLCMEMEHAPTCIYATGFVCATLVEEGGEEWTDPTNGATLRLKRPECTCGYFALLDRAREKLRASR